jgi:hypothetical protein
VAGRRLAGLVGPRATAALRPGDRRTGRLFAILARDILPLGVASGSIVVMRRRPPVLSCYWPLELSAMLLKRFARPPQNLPWSRLLALMLAVSCAASSSAKPPTAAKDDNPKAEPAIGEQWVRVTEDKDGKPQAMQTAIVRYVKRDDYKPGQAGGVYAEYVDLVGAVHIADRAYYNELNRRFKKYDAVLYELVAPEGTQVPKGRGTSNAHPLGALQNGMKSMLNVEHQLEQIDYTRPNMVHADLSPAEFLQSMDQRDEGFAQMYFRMLGASMAQQSQQAAQGESADVDFLTAMFSKDRPRQLKIAMAKQFEGMESLLVGIAGPDGSTLITERNKRALDVLEKQLGQGVARLAIFYGAGHLSDMHKQLAERFDMTPVSIEWLDAWNLRKK